MNSSPLRDNAQVLRSAKKLANVLGSAPFEFDLAGPEYLGLVLPTGNRPLPVVDSAKSKKRHGLVYPKESTTVSFTRAMMSSSQSSLGSMSSQSSIPAQTPVPTPKRTKIKTKPAPLVFSPSIFAPSYNINAAPFPIIVLEASPSVYSPLSPFVAALAASPTNTVPLSGKLNTQSALRTPSTPERIRKVTKLNRMLGENIPVNLILAQTNPRAAVKGKSIARRRSTKRLPIPEPFVPQYNDFLGIPNTTRRPSLADSVSAASASVLNRGVFSYGTAAGERHGHGRNRSHTIAQNIAVEPSPAPAVLVDGSGWQGSWNLGSMQDVRHKLRTLKH